MVDVSYSMSDADPQGSWFAANPSKLDVARAELVKVLASVPPGVRVNVVAFSSHVATLWPASRTMDDAGLAEAVRWVAALRPADETHPLEALEAAAALNPDQIVLLSDGRPSDSEAVLRSVVQRVDVIAARARVDVVGFGADQDREFLATLAGHGRGTLRLR
jgi:antitoxin (DNA-binding transcriptional repressor) of toxin-antitoxin stability system